MAKRCCIIYMYDLGMIGLVDKNIPKFYTKKIHIKTYFHFIPDASTDRTALNQSFGSSF